MRNQKISLNRKFKEHEEKYKKWKLAKGSELLNIRKMNVMKDRQISKLTREKRKNELIAQRNAAELKVLKKRRKQEEAQRKKSEMIRRKRLKPGANKRRTKGKGKKKAIPAQQPPQKTALAVEIEKVREWIEANVEKMVTVKHLQKDIENFRLQKNQIEAEIEDEQKYYSEISIKKEKAIMKRGKIKMENEEGECLILDKDIEEYDSILHKNQENIESLEDKIGYFDKRISSLESAIDEVNNEDIKGLDLEKVDSVQSAKTLLVAFFNILLEVKVQKVNLEDTLVEQHSSIKDLEKEIRILRDSKKAGEIQFNKALQEREKEYLELESKLLQETEEKINETKIQMSTNSEIISLESRRTQKKKLEKNFSTEAYEDSKRKLSKMMSQLERKLLVEEKKNLTMSNMVEQSKAEKEQYKQKYNNLRKKIKQDEIHQIKISKLGGIESSGYQGGGQSDQNYASNKLNDYKDMRKDRKITNNKINLEPQESTPYSEMANNILAPDIPVLREAKSSNFKRKSLIFGEQTNSNVFDRLMNQSTITSKIKERPPVPREGEIMTSPTLVEGADTFSTAIEGISQSDLIINCDFSVENAHNGPIYSITNIENQLYTCSKGSLKIWDIDTMTNISDISAHSGIIRSLCVLPEQKLLAAACEKYIILWDLVSLTNVATLKSHQGDINMLKRGDNILLSGGASGFDNSPTLYAWDLRTSNPVEERETTEVQ